MHEYDVYFGMVPTNLANLTNWEITHAGINSEHIRQPAKFCNHSPVENQNDLELDFKVFFFIDSCC